MPADIIEHFATPPSSGTLPPVFSPFQTRYDDLKAKLANQIKRFDPTNTTPYNPTDPNSSLLDLLRKAKADFKAYVESSGADTKFYDTQKKLDQELKNYDSNIIDELINLRKDIINATDINKKMGLLTTANNELEAKKKDLELQKDNYTTAQVRNTALNTHGEAISYHQTWGLIQRPIKKQSVPVLLVFTLLFLYVGVLGIYYISPLPTIIATAWSAQLPSFGEGGGGAFVGLITSIVQSPFAVSIVISSAVILAIVLIMKFTGRV